MTRHQLGDIVYYHGAMNLVRAKITQVDVAPATLDPPLKKGGTYYSIETVPDIVTRHSWIFVIHESQLLTAEEAVARKLMER